MSRLDVDAVPRKRYNGQVAQCDLDLHGVPCAVAEVPPPRRVIRSMSEVSLRNWSVPDNSHLQRIPTLSAANSNTVENIFPAAPTRRMLRTNRIVSEKKYSDGPNSKVNPGVPVGLPGV
jgi:hypothetical protein